METISHIKSRFAAASVEELSLLCDMYESDQRAGVASLIKSAQRRIDGNQALVDRAKNLYSLQTILNAEGSQVIIGIDEVGRGAVAGPLTVAAVVLKTEPVILGLDDSKRLTAQRREELSAIICREAEAIGIAHIPPEEIDLFGMSVCLRAAMRKALLATGVEPDVVLVDGNPVHIHEKEQAVVKGDSTHACIAAASIVAKVTRDALMVELDQQYPGYEFAHSKGYASAKHIAAIGESGLTDVHRKSFCTNFTKESLF